MKPPPDRASSPAPHPPPLGTASEHGARAGIPTGRRPHHRGRSTAQLWTLESHTGLQLNPNLPTLPEEKLNVIISASTVQ